MQPTEIYGNNFSGIYLVSQQLNGIKRFEEYILI